ncbi:hypothetical protein HYPSUDRAFT_1039944 [Hypholoma sublateritium FD-334 SS-4]|uniref:Uncharacterized protein n=1 Tax=Hypholoma sublateritium (strain FD-334 SS-4) TaxID=945553 RepID=A0A0D2P7M2_HYPSF|nr:hypothetical protein HYPSUDRAFT_1039944 [Hypholoma sublateritium FD-334 SS-4]
MCLYWFVFPACIWVSWVFSPRRGIVSIPILFSYTCTPPLLNTAIHEPTLSITLCSWTLIPDIIHPTTLIVLSTLFYLSFFRSIRIFRIHVSYNAHTIQPHPRTPPCLRTPACTRQPPYTQNCCTPHVNNNQVSCAHPTEQELPSIPRAATGSNQLIARLFTGV